MNKVNGYTITEDVFCNWEQRFVPDYDLLFFKRKPDFVSAIQIESISKDFYTLDERTSFGTWAVKDANYVARVPNREFLLWDKHTQASCIREQWEIGRYLVFPLPDMVDLLEGLSEVEQKRALNLFRNGQTVYYHPNEELIMIQGHSWTLIPIDTKRIILRNYVKYWLHDHALFSTLRKQVNSLLVEKVPELAPYFDRFPTINGPNCLAAVATAIIGSNQLIYEWLHPLDFERILQNNEYKKGSFIEIQSDDVLVWRKEYTIVHAAYALDEKYLFNKHGQTMFNPWQVLRASDVLKNWKDSSLDIYRKEIK